MILTVLVRNVIPLKGEWLPKWIKKIYNNKKQKVYTMSGASARSHMSLAINLVVDQKSPKLVKQVRNETLNFLALTPMSPLDLQCYSGICHRLYSVRSWKQSVSASILTVTSYRRMCLTNCTEIYIRTLFSPYFRSTAINSQPNSYNITTSQNH